MNNKTKRILIGISCIVLGIVLAYFLWTPKEEKDSKKFSVEYTKVAENNVFVYKTIDEIIHILENGTGVVYLGFPECPWCQAYVKYLDEAAKESGIDKIYYFNILEDRKNNSKEYQKIVELLGDNLLYNDEGNHRVYVPDVTFVKNGKIIGHDNETSVVTEEDGTPEMYWTDEKVTELKTKLKIYFKEVNENTCTTCGE